MSYNDKDYFLIKWDEINKICNRSMVQSTMYNGVIDNIDLDFFIPS